MMLLTRRIQLLVIPALVLVPLSPPFQPEAGAQTPVGDTTTGLAGQRIIMLQGMGTVHIAGTDEAPRTAVGINLVMPVRRVDGRKVWIVSTSGGDSGWADIGSVRLLNGSVGYFDTLITKDPRNWDAYLRRAEAEHALTCVTPQPATTQKRSRFTPAKHFSIYEEDVTTTRSNGVPRSLRISTVPSSSRPVRRTKTTTLWPSYIV